MTGRVQLILLLLASCLLALALAIAPGARRTAHGQEGAKYKGSKACEMCHGDEHKTWEEMKHSKAFAVLSPEQVAGAKDPKGRVCVQCHTTGYGKGGFEDKEKTPKLANVGCESCHGPGSQHIMTMVMAEEDEKIADMKISRNVGCTQCHDPHISYKKLYGKK